MEDNSASTNSGDKYKRKRKKTFMSNAKKYMKRGYYGRGSKIEGDTYHYLLKIMEAYKEGFPSDDEKIIFVRNAMQQTENKEIDICCNQVGCRVIETLLPSADEEIIRRFITILGGELRPLCCDRFASHVLCALLAITCKNSLTLPEDNKFKLECKEFTFKISKFLLNNLEDYVWDTYATHVIRSVIRNLAQTPKVDEKTNKIIEQVLEIDVPEDYKEIIVDLGERLIAWPQFSEFPDSEYTSGLLQVLIPALSKLGATKLHKKYILKLLTDHFSVGIDENSTTALPKAFLSLPAQILLNQCVESIGDNEKLFLKYYEGLFKGRLSQLAISKINNRAVQNLLNNCQGKAMYELIFDELVDSFNDVIDSSNFNVISTMGSACKRLACRQGQFLQGIMKALKCFEPEERQNSLLLCLSRFVKFEDLPKENTNLDKEKLNMQGTIVVQTILEFNKPIKLVNSILNTELNVLKGLFMNINGCHIMDAYMKSSFVGEKSREKLIKKLQGGYQTLVISRYGSRSFDAIWEVASLKNKEFILQELSHQSGSWTHNEYGKHIARKVNIDQFMKNRDSWRAAIGKPQKSKEILLT